jgi:hypothetical protein
MSEAGTWNTGTEQRQLYPESHRAQSHPTGCCQESGQSQSKQGAVASQKALWFEYGLSCFFVVCFVSNGSHAGSLVLSMVIVKGVGTFKRPGLVESN